MTVVFGVAWEGATSDVLVEELYPVKAIRDQAANETVRDLPCPGDTQATGVAWSPCLVPPLAP